MSRIFLLTIAVLFASSEFLLGQDADCQGLGGKPLFALKAVGVNGSPIGPVNDIHAMPGDILQTEILVSCWGMSSLPLIDTYQSSILVGVGAVSGTFGTLLPLGWDAPVEKDYAPCDNPAFPILSPAYGCVGPAHDPSLGAQLETTRPDFIFPGAVLFAVAYDGLFHYRFGATVDCDRMVPDDGELKYGGSLNLTASPSSCGTFTIPFEPDVNQSFLMFFNCSLPGFVLPRLQDLIVHVCEDDGLFCNGLEICDPDVGCRIIPPPSCDDGVACTVDSCDEGAGGCAHLLNHAACDDGNDCTLDECTPTGCTHIFAQCNNIPTLSVWGLVVLALGLLVLFKLRFRAISV